MKNKILLSLLIVLTFSFFYCKKESLPSIVGNWATTAIYTDPSTGGYGWYILPEGAWVEVGFFRPDKRFSFFTDTPGGSGSYDFNYSTHELYLHYKDQDGNSFGTVLNKVESLTNDKIVISYVSVSGGIVKKEYRRFD